MLLSLALIFLLGSAAAALCRRVGLPRILGMLAVGILLGPYALNLMSDSILSISSDLRNMALIIILIKAGLTLNLADLKKVGRPAVLMSFLPALFELSAITLLAPPLLGLSWAEAALLGCVLAAVSPAVVVPKMVELMEKRRGTQHGVPQLILAGASLDDVFVIVLFSTFLSRVQGESTGAAALLDIPVSLVTGCAAGIGLGWLLALFFEKRHAQGRSIRNTSKVILVLGVAFLLAGIETLLKGTLAFSGMLAVMSMACALQVKSRPVSAVRLSEKFGKLWLAAELLLFVLVGSAVDIRFTLRAGLPAVALILLALAVRCIGVWLSLLGTPFTLKERLFCMIAYLPKATVQAAIGSVPLALGLPCGALVLSVAVLSILLCAPLGALGMEATYSRLLKQEPALDKLS